jgi:hypothetical protein
MFGLARLADVRLSRAIVETGSYASIPPPRTIAEFVVYVFPTDNSTEAERLAAEIRAGLF